MSKSKLNKRQLKKISKLALMASVRLGLAFGEDAEFCKRTGEFYVCPKYAEEELTALGLIGGEFFWKGPSSGSDDQGYPIPNKKPYLSLSFVNTIHYMIKYLENNNEN